MRKIYLSLSAAFLFSLTSFAQECGVIYVTTAGAGSGAAGTKANPASFTYGMSLASLSNNKVYVATGLYTLSNQVSIPSGVTIEGGFNAADWSKSNTAATTLHRDASNVNVSGNGLIALYANSKSNFRLQDLTIEVEDAPTSQGSTYGINLYFCSDYSIVRCTVITGKGGDGLAATLTGADGLPGAPGDPGAVGDGDGGGFGAGGIGGAGGGSPAATGGNGALSGGGYGAGGDSPFSARGGGGGGGGAAGGVDDNDGGGGGNGGGFTGSNASGGGAGHFQGSTTCNSISNCNNDLSGDPGGAGTNGVNGGAAGAANPGLHFNGFFNPGMGGQGADGTGGQGGKGGGGGGGEDGLTCDAGSGSGGGGGGGGGEGGEGGPGGEGGGGSFCIYLTANQANGIITDCSLQPGLAGQGGASGAGGQGGTGGTGGIGGTFDDGDIGCGGNGGNGGDGGDGSAGGQGPDGESLRVHQDGTTAVVVNDTVVPGSPPDLTVVNPGCVGAIVTFSGTTGSSWDFGAGANPATAIGTGPHSVTYSTTGRKTIQYDGATFTEYISIHNNLPALNLPSITASSNTINQGCPVTFTTTANSSNYQWNFGALSNPPTASGTTLTTTGNVTFNAPGSHTVYLTLTTSCCGDVVDSLVINVNAQSITLTASPSASVCPGQTVTFTATTGFGNYIFLNGNSGIQSSASNTYSNPNLASGSNIRVAVSSGGCTLISDTVTFIINPNPVADLGNDTTICGSATITLDAGSGYTAYLWSPGGETTQTITTGTGTYDVQITDVNGCQGTGDIVITAGSSLNPVINPAGPISLCAGNTVVLDAGSGFDTYLWAPGGATTQTITVSAAGDYSVAVSGSGCTGSSDTVEVDFDATVSPTIVVNVHHLCIPDTFCTYQWQFNETDIPGAMSNCYDITQSGYFTVEVTDCGGCSGESPPVELSFIGVEEQDFADYLSVYPNPTEGTLILELTFDQPEDLVIRLNDVTGREISAAMQLEAVRSVRKEISMAEFADGFYFLVLEKNDTRFVKKVLKK